MADLGVDEAVQRAPVDQQAGTDTGSHGQVAERGHATPGAPPVLAHGGRAHVMVAGDRDHESVADRAGDRHVLPARLRKLLLKNLVHVLQVRQKKLLPKNHELPGMVRGVRKLLSKSRVRQVRNHRSVALNGQRRRDNNVRVRAGQAHLAIDNRF